MRTAQLPNFSGDVAFTIFLVGTFAWPGYGPGDGFGLPSNQYSWPFLMGSAGATPRTTIVVEISTGSGRLDFATSAFADCQSDFYGPWAIAKPCVIVMSRNTGDAISGTLVKVDGQARSTSGDAGTLAIEGNRPLVLDYGGYANMNVSEVIVYKRKLAPQEEAAVGAYLRHKYDLNNRYPPSLSVSLSSGEAHIGWTSCVGVTNRLQVKDSLSSAVWSNTANIFAGDGTWQSVTNSVQDIPCRFYRLFSLQ
jgi:hypothetical protein